MKIEIRTDAETKSNGMIHFFLLCLVELMERYDK